jgi:hypothetical protein
MNGANKQSGAYFGCLPQLELAEIIMLSSNFHRPQAQIPLGRDSKTPDYINFERRLSFNCLGIIMKVTRAVKI